MNVIFLISLLIPGSFHLKFKRFKIGLAGIVLFLIEILTIVTFIIPNLLLLAYKQDDGKYTIGAVPMEHDSFLILVGSVVGLLMIIAFFVINYFFARDARNIDQQLKEYGYAQSSIEKMREVSSELIPNAITLPKFILIFIFTIIPAIVSILVAFTNYRTPVLPPAFLIEWRGLDNFSKLVNDDATRSVFTDTFMWTMIWTLSASTLVIVLGTTLAVVANNKHIRGKKFFRTVYILPWAVPAFLTILVFQVFFSKIGTMNTVVMPFLTGEDYSVSNAIGFLLNKDSARILIILIQGWLGFPYVFILVTGVLQTIPDDLYEASSIDGGGPVTNFFDITLPLILISVAPVFITQFTFNFNNVTIIYLLGEATVKDVGSLYGPLETISSLGFRLMIDAKYNEAAVFTLITSTLVAIVVLFTWIRMGAFKNEEVM